MLTQRHNAQVILAIFKAFTSFCLLSLFLIKAHQGTGTPWFAYFLILLGIPWKQKRLLAADVKMEIPVLVRSLKTSILSSTSFQMGKTFWGVVSAAGEQSRRKDNIVVDVWCFKFLMESRRRNSFWDVSFLNKNRLLRETGNLALEADPRIPPNQKKSGLISVQTCYLDEILPIFMALVGCNIFSLAEGFSFTITTFTVSLLKLCGLSCVQSYYFIYCL